jgi:hypothetical protein
MYPNDDVGNTYDGFCNDFPIGGPHNVNIDILYEEGCTTRTKVVIPEIDPPLSPQLEILTIDPCEGAVELKVDIIGGAEPYIIHWDTNGDGISDDTTSTFIKELMLLVGTSNTIILDIIDVHGCQVTIDTTFEIAALDQESLCCDDFGLVPPINYVACLEYNSSLSAFCGGNFIFDHFNRPSVENSPIINDSIKSQVIIAYQSARDNPSYFPINDIEQNYPEIHRITGYNLNGVEIEDFPQTTILNIYPIDYHFDVPFELLRLFRLNQQKREWVKLDSTWANDNLHSVQGVIGKLGDIYAVMGYEPLDFVIDGVGNYPNPLRPGPDDATIIKYTLSVDCNLDIKIFTATGGLVKSWELTNEDDFAQGDISGITHYLNWDGTNIDERKVANGVYLLVIKATSATDGRIVEKQHKIAVAK